MSVTTTLEPSIWRAFAFSKGIGDGLRHRRREFDTALDLVVDDLQVERREDLALDRGRGLA